MCTATYLVASWVFPIFLAATNWVMILRVYAMWHQSKRIFYILLSIYVPQVIVSFVYDGIYNSYLSVMVVQVIDFSFCSISFNNAQLGFTGFTASSFVTFVFSVMLFSLAITSTLKEVVVMYEATRQWQPNQYMKLLMKDGILYFLVNITQALLQSNPTAVYSASQFDLFLLCYTTLCPMVPRFIISVRELYDRDLRGRWQGIDTGFGVLSQPVFSENAAVSAIVFTDVAPGQEQGQVAEGEVDDSELIQLGVLGDGSTRQV